jgi:hypothetical protein
VLGAVAFLAWPAPLTDKVRPTPRQEATSKPRADVMDVGKSRIADPGERKPPPVPEPPDGSPGKVGEGKVLDLTAEVVELEGPVTDLDGRVLPER